MNHALSNKIKLISIVLLFSINIKTYLYTFTIEDNILNNKSNNVNNLKILNNTFLIEVNIIYKAL